MKKITSFFAVIMMLLPGINLQAQISAERQVIGSTGNLANSGAIIAFSNVGEAIIPTFTQPSLVVTQGFEQTDTTMTPEGIKPVDASALNISIYPNPNNGKFQVYCLSAGTASPNNQVSNIEIYNLLGKKVYSVSNINQQTLNNKTDIDVSAFPSGMYVVQIKTGNDLAIIKVVKEN